MLEPGGSFVNIDHFRSGDRTRAEMEQLRRMHPDQAAENDRVRQSFQWIYDQDRDHPIEFHTDPYEFCELAPGCRIPEGARLRLLAAELRRRDRAQARPRQTGGREAGGEACRRR